MMKIKKQKGEQETKFDEILTQIIEEHDSAVDELKSIATMADSNKDEYEEELEQFTSETLNQQKAWKKGFAQGMFVATTGVSLIVGAGLYVAEKVKK